MKLIDLILEHEKSLDEKNDALLMDKEVRRFSALKKRRSEEENVKILTKIINKYADLFDKVERKFHDMLHKDTVKKYPNAEILHQKKSVPSIISKIIQRDKPIEDISDLVRGAVLFKDKEEMNDFVKRFIRRHPDKVTKVDKKEYDPNDKLGYHGPVHIDMHIDGLDTELIVSPKRLWKYKEKGHELYDKWRNRPEDVPEFDASVSRHIYNIGNKSKYHRETPKFYREAMDEAIHGEHGTWISFRYE